MSSRTSGLEAKDPFLIEYKQSLREVVEGLKEVGGSGLRLLMVEMIRSRWIKDRRATYPFEIAWVFDRKDEAVSRMLTGLEESGDIEQVGLGRTKKGPMKPYKPRSLRKASSPGHVVTARKRFVTAKRT